jgi:hypothetical protein
LDDVAKAAEAKRKAKAANTLKELNAASRRQQAGGARKAITTQPRNLAARPAPSLPLKRPLHDPDAVRNNSFPNSAARRLFMFVIG